MKWTKLVIGFAGAATGGVVGAAFFRPKEVGVLRFPKNQIDLPKIRREERTVEVAMELEALDWRWKQYQQMVEWRKLPPLSDDYPVNVILADPPRDPSYTVAKLISDRQVDLRDLEMSPKEIAESIQQWKFERPQDLKSLPRHPYQPSPDWIKSIQFKMLYWVFR